MSNYNWCHGPNCHTNHTQSRIRGSGDNKVLRTIKIKQGGSYRTHEHYSMFNYFCNQSCLMDYIRTHLQSIVAIAPRREALETPILDPSKEKVVHQWGSYTNTKIEVDETRSTDIG